MIEVNLLPGGKKGSSGGLAFSMPKLGSLLPGRGGGGGGASMDPYLLFAIVAAVVGLGYMGWSFFAANGRTEDLNVQLEEERQDSIRFAAIIEQSNQLQARGDSIARRVQVIQEIDQGRFVWPHLLDEVAAAVPDYTWLREVLQQTASPLTVRLSGRAGSIFAITQFMRRLEASRFLHTVQMENTQQIPSEESPEDLVYLFELVLSYESPPIDELETVPLFSGASAMTASPPPGN